MSDPAAEHLATRRSAGLFDFSFMGMYELASVDVIEPLQSRRLARLAPGRIAYTLLMNDDGSVFIDATAWRMPDGRWWLFSGRPSDFAWIAARASARDRSDEHAVLALQGPESGRILARLAGESAVRALPYFGFTQARCGGVQACIGRLGYSGELGYEFIVQQGEAAKLRAALLDAGGPRLRECTFEAADSLRIEAGYLLFDREITGRERPEELGLERLVERPGRALQAPPRCLVGLEIFERPAQAALRPDLPIASATSERHSPLFERQLALGFIRTAAAQSGDLVRLGDGRLARVARLPFYDPPRRRPRATPL